MSTVSRLYRAYSLGQPVMFDSLEVECLVDHISNLEKELSDARKEYGELVHQSLCHAQESTGLLLKATLAGCLIAAEDPGATEGLTKFAKEVVGCE